MVRALPRKTVYAATLIAILALVGGWTLAAGTTSVQGPGQQSSVTVTVPTGFTTATVQSTQMLTVSTAILTNLTGPAGTQAGSGAGLNSTGTTTVANAVLASCAAGYCAGNYSAVDATDSLLLGDTALQVFLMVDQPTTTAVGFDIQVEIIYANAATPGTNVYVFGTGYFDTGTTSLSAPAQFGVGLFVDLGSSALNIPSIGDIVITMNACQTALSCP